MIHHHFGCSCPAPACVRARRNQSGFDRFLLIIFAALYLAGAYVILTSGMFAWIKF